MPRAGVGVGWAANWSVEYKGQVGCPANDIGRYIVPNWVRGGLKFHGTVHCRAGGCMLACLSELSDGIFVCLPRGVSSF